MYVCMSVCMYVCLSVYMHVLVHVKMHACEDACVRFSSHMATAGLVSMSLSQGRLEQASEQRALIVVPIPLLGVLLVVRAEGEDHRWGPAGPGHEVGAKRAPMQGRSVAEMLSPTGEAPARDGQLPTDTPRTHNVKRTAAPPPCDQQ